jgi:hypothetical protein
VWGGCSKWWHQLVVLEVLPSAAFALKAHDCTMAGVMHREDLPPKSHRKCRYHMLSPPFNLPVTVNRTPRSIALWKGDHGVWQHHARECVSEMSLLNAHDSSIR